MYWKNNVWLLSAAAVLLMFYSEPSVAQGPVNPNPAGPGIVVPDADLVDIAEDSCGDAGDEEPLPLDITSGKPPDGCYDNDAALRTAATDNATAGYCARGVTNILLAQGFDVNRVHYAKNYGAMLMSKPGWVLDMSYTEKTAPIGAILVYSHQPPLTNCCPGGNIAGHVEIVGEQNGQRVYISDKARTKDSPRPLIGVYIYKGNDINGNPCG